MYIIQTFNQNELQTFYILNELQTEWIQTVYILKHYNESISWMYPTSLSILTFPWTLILVGEISSLHSVKSCQL